MQITSIDRIKTTSFTIHLLLFVLLIRFCFSTLNITNINSNFNAEIILEKLNSEDLSVLKNKNYFLFLISLIIDEKNEIIKKKRLDDFDKTLTWKYINAIKYKFIAIKHEIIPIKETNEILKIFIENLKEISEISIFNNPFYNETILNLIYILYK